MALGRQKPAKRMARQWGLHEVAESIDQAVTNSVEGKPSGLQVVQTVGTHTVTLANRDKTLWAKSQPEQATMFAASRPPGSRLYEVFARGIFPEKRYGKEYDKSLMIGFTPDEIIYAESKRYSIQGDERKEIPVPNNYLSPILRRIRNAEELGRGIDAIKALLQASEVDLVLLPEIPGAGEQPLLTSAEPQ